MGITKGVAWALGLYESDEHYQKRLNKWNKKQDEQYKTISRVILGDLEDEGYQEAFEELENANKHGYNFNIPIAIKQIWATKPEIKEKKTNWTFEEYYQKLEQKNNKTDLDKEKEILQLKIKLAELEKNK